MVHKYFCVFVQKDFDMLDVVSTSLPTLLLQSYSRKL